LTREGISEEGEAIGAGEATEVEGGESGEAGEGNDGTMELIVVKQVRNAFALYDLGRQDNHSFHSINQENNECPQVRK
jgi:hypothetical protein